MAQRNDTYRPRKRRDGLLVHEVEGETLVYDRERDRAHCLNPAASRVWDHCDGRRSVAEIARLIARETDAPFDRDAVWTALAQLRSRRLLEPAVEVEMPRISRRELVRKLATAAALAVPIVTSVTAPSAVEAQSCVPIGGACTSTAQCCGIPFTQCCTAGPNSGTCQASCDV